MLVAPRAEWNDSRWLGPRYFSLSCYEWHTLIYLLLNSSFCLIGIALLPVWDIHSSNLKSMLSLRLKRAIFTLEKSLIYTFKWCGLVLRIPSIFCWVWGKHVSCNILYRHITQILTDDPGVCNNWFQTIKTFILNEFLPPKLPLFMFAMFTVVSIAKYLNSCILGLTVTKLSYHFQIAN